LDQLLLLSFGIEPHLVGAEVVHGEVLLVGVEGLVGQPHRELEHCVFLFLEGRAQGILVGHDLAEVALAELQGIDTSHVGPVLQLATS